MFNQFRLHYPKGSLVTELSAIDHGNYIVRCLVQVEGTTLVTALAAAQTVELAEDQARYRALAVLGINSTTTTESKPTPVAQTEGSKPMTLTSMAPAALASEQLHESQSTWLPEPSAIAQTNSFSYHNSNQEEVTEEALHEVSTYPDFETPLRKTNKKSSPTQLTDPPATVSAPSQLRLEEDMSQITTPDTPIDFSDIIARTNVELKRLGWTTQKGKDYLLQTYGKKSRQLLTNAEILDFLHYLEAQPTPED